MELPFKANPLNSLNRFKMFHFILFLLVIIFEPYFYFIILEVDFIIKS